MLKTPMTNRKAALIGAVLAASAFFAGSAQASRVHWSVSVQAPAVTTVVSNGRFYEPPPVYMAPAPVYYEPAPVVYRPPVVVYRPAPPPDWYHYHHRHGGWRDHRDEYGDRYRHDRWDDRRGGRR